MRSRSAGREGGFFRLMFMQKGRIKKFASALLAAGMWSASAQAGVEADPQWLALGHYRPQLFGSLESTIDTPNFFLAPDGKNNPKAELEATAALFNEGRDIDKMCVFPARYKFLKAQGLTKTKFPECKEYEEFRRDLRPAGVTLLFTDAYMNNPSSLFGHTLMRIDTSRKGTQLLAHGVNYGAFTAGQENSVLFAVWGLTGGFYGGFTVKPYYDIINTYNNLENRDIWEYNLNLTPEELDMFVAHLWEVGQTQTRYYFFTENCSYMLMEVLDAVRPSLKLADNFPVQAIPLDTVKAVKSRPGLVKSVNYRPSRQSKIRYRFKQMNRAQKQAYYEAIRRQNWALAGLEEDEKADVLETAYQYVQYQYVAKDLELKEYRRRSFQSLKARSEISRAPHFAEHDAGRPPETGHDSMRAVIGTGGRNGEAFQEIQYRPAYHSLTDDNYGFLRGAEINFLNATLRHYDNRDKTVLQKLDLVGIKSLSPADLMFLPTSYTIMADIERVYDPQTEKEGYAFNLKVGGGLTYALTDEFWVYAMNSLYGSYGGFLPHDQWAGIGFAGGVYADFGRWRLLAEAEKVFATSHFAESMKYSAEAAVSMTRNTALAVSYKYQVNYGHDIDEFMTSLRFYF